MTRPASAGDTAERRLVLTAEIPVRWADQDTNGHVNNATYFTYFEQTRILWLRSEVMIARRLKHEGIVVAQASCNYLKPIPYPETLRIPMFIGKHFELRHITIGHCFYCRNGFIFQNGEDRKSVV